MSEEPQPPAHLAQRPPLFDAAFDDDISDFALASQLAPFVSGRARAASRECVPSNVLAESREPREGSALVESRHPGENNPFDIDTSTALPAPISSSFTFDDEDDDLTSTQWQFIKQHDNDEDPTRSPSVTNKSVVPETPVAAQPPANSISRRKHAYAGSSHAQDERFRDLSASPERSVGEEVRLQSMLARTPKMARRKGRFRRRHRESSIDRIASGQLKFFVDCAVGPSQNESERPVDNDAVDVCDFVAAEITPSVEFRDSSERDVEFSALESEIRHRGSPLPSISPPKNETTVNIPSRTDSISNEISEQELLAYVQSGAMDFGYDDLNSQQPPPQSTLGTTPPILPSPLAANSGFRTGRNCKISIPQDKLEFGRQLIDSYQTDSSVADLRPLNGSGLDGGGFRKPPVALSLADLAMNASQQRKTTVSVGVTPRSLGPFTTPFKATPFPPLSFHATSGNPVTSTPYSVTKIPDAYEPTFSTGGFKKLAPPFSKQRGDKNTAALLQKLFCDDEEEEGGGVGDVLAVDFGDGGDGGVGLSKSGVEASGIDSQEFGKEFIGGGVCVEGERADVNPTGSRDPHDEFSPTSSKDAIVFGRGAGNDVFSGGFLEKSGSSKPVDFDFIGGFGGGGCGFMTGNRKKLAAPSVANAAKARELLMRSDVIGSWMVAGEGSGDVVGDESKLEHQSLAGVEDTESTRRAREFFKESTDEFSDPIPPPQAQPPVIPHPRLAVKSSGFSFASGKKMAPVNSDAVKSFWAGIVDDEDLVKSSTAWETPPTPAPRAQPSPANFSTPLKVGFSSGKGRALPKPSLEQLQKRDSLFSSVSGASTLPGMGTPLPSSVQRTFPETPLPTSRTTIPTIPSVIPTLSTTTTQTPSRPLKTPKQKGFKTPFLSASAKSNEPSFTTPRPVHQPFIASLNGSVSSHDLAMTPGPFSGIKKPFKTPGMTQKKFVSPMIKGGGVGGGTPVHGKRVDRMAGGGGESVKKVEQRVFFNLKDPPPRVTMREILQNSRHIGSVSERSEAVLHMTSLSAKSFHFPTASGPNWGPIECMNELLAMGMNANKVTIAWVNNHYRWIVWKLAAMARTFPDLKESCWSVEGVRRQFLYRYQREYCDGKRSCLNLIIEGDAPSEALIVLCVADVFVEGNSVLETGVDLSSAAPENIVLELTDGWYSLKTQLDPVLCRTLVNGKFGVGYKLLICGAQTVGERGTKSPLEIADRLHLKICSNGTRLAKWDAKLGYQKRSCPFQVGIARVSAEGGPIPLVDVVVTRVYPVMFIESKVKRTQVEEDEEARKYEERMNIECQRIAYEYQKSSDGASLEGIDIRGEAEDAVPRRNVSLMLRLKVCDFPPDGHSVETCATTTLTVWNPDPAVLEVLKEGKRVKMMGLLPDTYESATPCFLKMGPKKMLYPIPVTPQELKRTLYMPRTYTSIVELEGLDNGSEFDVMGVACSTGEQCVEIVDEGMVRLKVQAYYKCFGKIKVGDVVALRNLKHHFGTAIFAKECGVLVSAFNKVEQDMRDRLIEFR
ncbi:Breast cancer 2, early onset [Podochytrium sp. JEL0797]|nr:Breast cancer 2, early onset [Podochytrium sp. JEL0797]